MTLVPSLLPFVTPECHADEVGCRLLALRGKHHERHLRIRSGVFAKIEGRVPVPQVTDKLNMVDNVGAVVPAFWGGKFTDFFKESSEISEVRERLRKLDIGLTTVSCCTLMSITTKDNLT